MFQENLFMCLFYFYFFSAPEKTWTYKCIDNKCVRQHYLGENHFEKRIPFISCTMKCGPANLWPIPTIKSALGSHSNMISVTLIKLDVRTSFKKAEELLKEAFIVFQNELIMMEKNSLSGVEEEKQAEIDANKNDVIVDEKNLLNRKNTMSLSNMEIEVHILKSPDIHLTLDTDESYNITITRKKLIIIEFIEQSYTASLLTNE